MFIRNAWYIAAWGDELGDKPLARRILNDPVVLFRDKIGKAAAIADRCCHRGTPLSLGEVVDAGCNAAITAWCSTAPANASTSPARTRFPTRPWCRPIRWSSATGLSGSGWAKRHRPIPRASSMPLGTTTPNIGDIATR